MYHSLDSLESIEIRNPRIVNLYLDINLDLFRFKQFEINFYQFADYIFNGINLWLCLVSVRLLPYMWARGGVNTFVLIKCFKWTKVSDYFGLRNARRQTLPAVFTRVFDIKLSCREMSKEYLKSFD